MKKTFLTLAFALYFLQNSFACADYDANGNYFNLFTQHIITDKSFTPFLLDYEDFYHVDGVKNIDANIQEWQKYFNGELTYAQCTALVYKVSMEELNNLKFGRSVQDKLLKKLGKQFYEKYKEGVDYLIEAKYLQPYMRITHQENEDSFYYQDENQKNASDMKFEHTRDALISLYNATQVPQIKLRYGYQLVRFLHYTRNYHEAVNAFNAYVLPLKTKSEVYYMALEQYAGALRAIERESGSLTASNWQFFQVFVHSKNRKKSAFLSLTFTGDADFNSLLDRAETQQDKIMAYFLLGYQGFNNPLPMMKKIANIDPNSEALKVLEARAINELERRFLPEYNLPYRDAEAAVEKEESIPDAPKKLSWWDRIVNFFKRLFGIGNEEKEENSAPESIIAKEGRRLPMFANDEYKEADYNAKAESLLAELIGFTENNRRRAHDVFWHIAYAYLKFLQKEYKESDAILAAIQTDNVEYQEQISNMRMFNEVVGKSLIDREFEEYLLQKYPNLFVEKEANDIYYELPSTKQFVFDILANRYFLQGEKAKSFLIHNHLSYIKYNADLALVKKLEAFYKKENKSNLEKKLLSKRMDVADPASLFHFVYGDAAMRYGEFEKAKLHYELVKNGDGFIAQEYWEWDSDFNKRTKSSYEEKGWYDGFNRIAKYIFGHNYRESFETPAEQTMEMEPFTDQFSFIKETMNKAELVAALIELEEIGKKKGERGAQANQLIGNVLYNTSKLGYYRQLFVMDITNGNGEKYHFYESGKQNHRFYYKGFIWAEYFDGAVDFDLAIRYYQKALEQSQDKEQQARILFQMASAEQGNYYQWEANQPKVSWRETGWYEREQAQRQKFAIVKAQKFNTYFGRLKAGYADTRTVRILVSRCANFDYFMNH